MDVFRSASRRRLQLFFFLASLELFPLPSLLGPIECLARDNVSQGAMDAPPLIVDPDAPTVNLVIASLRKDDISWTNHLRIPNLRVIRYVSDADADFTPPVPKKGREALIYHTYFHEFYDDLPDISIMIHAHEDPWHIEGVLRQSMLFTLSQLDLYWVKWRQYANLRVSWENACPDWINTTKTPKESEKQEEPFMREAFQANFGPVNVPEILAGPCCSQFAVTREAVRRNPKDQYKRSMDWLVQTGWTDYIAGRTWEHMFQWLFTGLPTDCPIEWKAYCRMYHICFENPAAPARVNALWQERKALMEDIEFGRELLNPQRGHKARKRMTEIERVVHAEIAVALDRGKKEENRAVGDLFAP
ncbi:hypothetical protein GQ53DRAFT_785132 [Thozetella sp. PMI_491]|nr:hypothetical protein GQ53DRAFT_785132 [Thozetella sp. PMI_491]